MSRLGQLSLQRVIVDYSPYGSAMGLRHAFAREIPQFKRDFPSVTIEVRPRGTASAVTGIYRDGSERTFHVKTLSSQAIYVRLHELAQTANDRSQYLNTATMHFQRRSVQGAWNPYLWLAERHEARVPVPKWDRELTDDEWRYYVAAYSARMRRDRARVSDELDKVTDLPNRMTAEIADRWKQFVTPHLQTDVAQNLATVKRQAEQNVAPAPVSLDEYKLFSAPDLAQTGGDLIRGLRHKEMRRIEKWWDRRRYQLKPPS